MNYYETIGLDQEPFSMAPSPEFFYRSKSHGECLNRMEISLRLNRGLNVIIGDIGMGKTTLSRLLLGRFIEFGENYKFYLILDPTWKDTTEFLIYLHKLFGITGPTTYRAEMMDRIEHFLIDVSVKEQKKIVLIIDEGQKMGAEQIEIIRTLLNFETNDQKLIQVIIFAQPELQTVIDEHPNFRDRIALGYQIPPLGQKDTIEFINHRLRVAGDKEGILITQEAKEMIYQETKGYPRKIVVFAHSLIIDMITAGKKEVNAAMVYERIKSPDFLHG